ncbi:bone morphogenetic protein receptor type-1B [Parasteatoda tepidariorum]|uniref:bone morphogenetic protein receptor type-1B n=1 Tax=Parasteatoda tepidariorum TaxID=114398 RepID=UPI00077FA444|nr:bone morphogenetic protein receptor type-1B [Parasteatoda tepidariorum]
MAVLLCYKCIRKIIFILILLSFVSTKVSSLVCYCAGNCPNDEWNGSCIARPLSVCFSSVEEVHNTETGQYEFERTYGCLPPDESGLMQCKGSLVPHKNPKGIACCADRDYCNLELKPFPNALTTAASPMYRGELSFYSTKENIIIFAIVLSVCIVLLAGVIGFMVARFCSQKENRRNYMDVEKTYLGGEAVKDLLDNANDNSGSGSGVALLVQRTVGKQIEMVESIGKGRFGEVWKAQLRDYYVAVKIFFTKEEASWQRETDIYKTVLLRHENILGFVAADIRGNGSWTQLLLITDYHELGSLHDFLKVWELDYTDMLKLAHSSACGVAHLHNEVTGKQGKPAIAHRDIKSRNILVKKDRTCVIADFGLAVKYKSDTNDLDVGANTRVGTKRYMPPEVLDETLNASQFEAYRMADMYSFALVLWEIAKRCVVNDIHEDYQLPFYDCVPTNPSFEDMKKVVCVDKRRPTMPKHWKDCQIMQDISKLMHESWKQNACARLTSLCLKKKLCKLEAQHRNSKLV